MSRPPDAVVDRTAYEAAAEMIASAAWWVNADQGLIFSAVTGRPIGSLNQYGYQQVAVYVEGRAFRPMSHRVVWESVHGPIAGGHLEINHINGVKHDNRITNLELVTPGANQRHALTTGLKTPTYGETVGSKLSAKDVAAMRCMRAGGAPLAPLAVLFDCSKAQVSRVVRGLSRSHG